MYARHVLHNSVRRWTARPLHAVPSTRLARKRLVRRRRRVAGGALVEGGQPSASSDSLVNDALQQISTYCEKLPAESSESLDCYDALNYFIHEAVAAEQECAHDVSDSGMTGQACRDFLQWERFVRTVEMSGGVKEMVRTILALKRARSSDPVPVPSHRKSSIVPVNDLLDDAHTRRLCEKLFKMKDKNQDGRINVEEFRSLMKLLGDEVHGETISVMFDALGVHGSLDFDEFFTILEAEAIRSHSPSAGMLRSAQRHGHHGDRPKWLDNV